jgi:pyridoxal biosynthesis lyase PdxS
MRRSACSSAPTASSSARASSSRAIRRQRAKAIVEATTHFDDAKVLADVSAGLGEPMVGISSSSLAEDERLEVRGW